MVGKFSFSEYVSDIARDTSKTNITSEMAVRKKSRHILDAIYFAACQRTEGVIATAGKTTQEIIQ